MDARPQRPVGGLRVQGDENIAPATSNMQTLHQRNKSMSALSNKLNMPAPGGLKGPAKRTAFGDVSNTARTMTTYDDSVVNNKQILHEIKPLAPQDRSVALLRPAQRPLNAAASKGPLNTMSATQSDPISFNAATKPTIAEVRQLPQQGPASKRTLSKRGTTIYKDTGAESVVPPPIPHATRPGTAPSVAPVYQSLGPRSHQSQPQLKQEQPILRRTQSKFLGNQSEVPGTGLPSDPIYVDASEPSTTDEHYGSYMPSQVQKTADELTVAYEDTNQTHQVQTAVDQALVPPPRRSLPAPPIVSEPEEYWEDEEEDNYDGYTTAHSYRSRGDNTTGGATTVLFPKITNRAKREIADAKETVERSRTQEEIEDEAWDTSMVAEYGDEIFAYMRELEIKMLPNAHYMDNQAEIQWSMRSVLMDWLIQVHHRFSLLPETLFLCVNYIDRFLSCKIVSLGKLQLVGATAIFVAAKYEEINCPSVSEIVYMVDGGYTVDEILKAERFMLSMLQFELGWPGPMSFLRRISKADDYDLESRTLAKYFLEVTIMDERFVGSPPSYVAAGAHCLARFMLKKGDWTQAHVYYSGYTWTQLRPLVSMMVECCENPQKHHSAVFDKYSDRRYKRASLFVQAEMDRGFILPSISVSNSRPSLPSLDDVASHMPFETRESFKRMVQVKG